MLKLPLQYIQITKLQIKTEKILNIKFYWRSSTIIVQVLVSLWKMQKNVNKHVKCCPWGGSISRKALKQDGYFQKCFKSQHLNCKKRFWSLLLGVISPQPAAAAGRFSLPSFHSVKDWHGASSGSLRARRSWLLISGLGELLRALWFPCSPACEPVCDSQSLLSGRGYTLAVCVTVASWINAVVMVVVLGRSLSLIPCECECLTHASAACGSRKRMKIEQSYNAFHSLCPIRENMQISGESCNGLWLRQARKSSLLLLGCDS